MNKTKEAQDFEIKWYHKIVRPRVTHYKIPIKNYTVTAALYEFETNKDTIFAVIAEDYDAKTNKHWFTFKISSENLEKHLDDFEIIEDKVT